MISERAMPDMSSTTETPYADGKILKHTASGVGVVILRGAGGKAFVSGADISQFEKTRHNASTSEEYARRSAAQRALLADYPKPTIASIQGFCLGGGMQVAMLADIRIASHGS